MLEKVNAAAKAAGEGTTDPDALFAALDTNKDGVIDASEAAQLESIVTRLTSGKATAGTTQPARKSSSSQTCAYALLV